jgi:hypothetical protein
LEEDESSAEEEGGRLNTKRRQKISITQLGRKTHLQPLLNEDPDADPAHRPKPEVAQVQDTLCLLRLSRRSSSRRGIETRYARRSVRPVTRALEGLPRVEGGKGEGGSRKGECESEAVTAEEEAGRGRGGASCGGAEGTGERGEGRGGRGLLPCRVANEGGEGRRPARGEHSEEL